MLFAIVFTSSMVKFNLNLFNRKENTQRAQIIFIYSFLFFRRFALGIAAENLFDSPFGDVKKFGENSPTRRVTPKKTKDKLL